MKLKDIKPSENRSLSIEEIEKLKKEKENLINLAKQEENKKFVQGNLNKNNLVQDPKKKFHLPVLHINDPQQWPSQPLENRLHWTDTNAYNTCLGNCCGVEGLKAGCCYLDPEDLEHVLGPLTGEDEQWIHDIVVWLREKKGITASRTDIVIDYEEGQLIGEKFFNGERKAVFQSKDSYPMLRFQVVGPRFACKFLTPSTGKCSIYERRPVMCRKYLCQYVKANFTINSKEHKATWVKVR